MIIFSPKNIWESRRLYFNRHDYYKTFRKRHLKYTNKSFNKIRVQKNLVKFFRITNMKQRANKIRKEKDFVKPFYKTNVKRKIIKNQENPAKFFRKTSIKQRIGKIKILRNFKKSFFPNKLKFRRNSIKTKSGYKNIKVIKKVRVFKTRGFNNNFVFSKNILFLKKLFSMFIKNGLKVKVINFFILFINYIKNKFKSFNKNIVINIYLYQLTSNILPVFNTIPLTRKGEKIKLPWLLNKKLKLKKLVSISSNWIKKSVLLRTEKTLFLKILSELESIRFGSSNSITLKKEYYRNFYKNKYFIRYLKKKNWI